MTDEQILSLASKYLELQPIHGDVSVWDEWCGKQEDLLKFAQEIYRKAYSTGHRDGYDDGWKGSKVSTEMNTWSSESSDDDL